MSHATSRATSAADGLFSALAIARPERLVSSVGRSSRRREEGRNAQCRSTARQSRPSAFRRGSSGPTATARSRPDRAAQPDPRFRARRTAPPAHEPRRSTRSSALADPAPALPALVGAAPPGRPRPAVRARQHGARAHDPDPDPARGRRGDRRRAQRAAASLPRRDRRPRDDPLRRELLAPLRDGARRCRRRGAPARAPLPRVPHLPARVLRPARDGRGDLPRDERHLPRALLHRLGSRPGAPERDDDHRRGDRARHRQRQAGADLRARDAADRGADVVLRAPPLPDLAPRAGEEGSPDGGLGRGRRRHRDGAGVRPRGGRADALPRTGRGRPARDHAAGDDRGALPPRSPHAADARDRRGPVLRRAAR